MYFIGQLSRIELLDTGRGWFGYFSAGKASSTWYPNNRVLSGLLNKLMQQLKGDKKFVLQQKILKLPIALNFINKKYLTTEFNYNTVGMKMIISN